MKPLSQCELKADKFLVKFEIEFSANVRELSPVIDRIMSLVRELNCAAGKEFEIEISLREALVNAVVHGCKSDPDKVVQCCVACDEALGVLITVRDPGPGFDPSKLPSPLAAQNLFKSHGRGIYLINQLMDEVSFKRGGTEIHMRKR